MTSRRAHLVRWSRHDNLPVLGDALMGFLVGIGLGDAPLSTTLATHGGAATTARPTDDTRGGDD